MNLRASPDGAAKLFLTAIIGLMIVIALPVAFRALWWILRLANEPPGLDIDPKYVWFPICGILLGILLGALIRLARRI